MLSRKAKMLGLWSVVILALWLVPSGYAQREPAAKLDELVKAAKAEGELSLVASAASWGAVEGVKMIQDALNKKYGLNIKIRYAPGPSMPVMAGRIIEMYKAGVKADTDLYVGSAVHMPTVLEAGVARSFPWKEVFPYIPEETIEFNGQIIRYVDVFNGITYNTREITGKDVPRRLEDILDPKWKGKIASTPYAASLNYLAVKRVWGHEKATAFVRALSRQASGLIRCGEESRIASGEFLMLVMNCGDYGAENYARKTGAPVASIIFEDAATMTSYYLVVPKNSAHPNLASLVAGFLMSKEGQEVLYKAVSWTSRAIEGTPNERKYKELKAKGIKVHDFTTANIIREEAGILSKAETEFQKILAGR